MDTTVSLSLVGREKAGEPRNNERGTGSMIYNEEFETLPREVLEVLQLKRLKQAVQRVYHTVGYYRRSFDEAG
ncbi:MAG TPA: hypothetical protein VF318_00400, partial [Dehalococcoidales bacterium]